MPRGILPPHTVRGPPLAGADLKCTVAHLQFFSFTANDVPSLYHVMNIDRVTMPSLLCALRCDVIVWVNIAQRKREK